MKRGRNATALAEAHPFAFDTRVTFQEDNHECRVDGVVVPVTVTSVVKQGFPEDFNAKKVIAKNLAKWRTDDCSRYFDIVDGRTDEEATAAIETLWNKARDDGTALHKFAAIFLNGEEVPTNIPPSEADLFLRGWELLVDAGHTAVRTELSVFWPPRGPASVAGQIDILTRARDGQLCLIDLKRTNRDLAPTARAFRNGVGALAVVGDTPFSRYSLQLSLYAVILSELTRERVGGMLLLQIDPVTNVTRIVECMDLRPQARVLLLET